MPKPIEASTDDAAEAEKPANAQTIAPRVAPLIVARNVTLQVPVFLPQERQLLSNPLRLVTDLYLGRSKRVYTTLLDNVSVKLMPGERLGLIGANGAGKSTLLKVLTGIYQPSSGTLKINGEATGLFGIALGMLNEATGLENIYMRGLQMGLTLKQIRALIPEVIDFAELEDAIERPLSTYSAGMRLRLTLAVSTMIKPDILLLDEWIGAGDEHFKTKFKQRMLDLVESSRGMVLATHSFNLMKALCTRALVLAEGRVVFSGPVDDAQQFYLENAQLRRRKPRQE
ncbi:MAG: ABC transporter ATP-binding protein [Hyphomonadaceae bacterium]|nr:ABC transporter ATP-binding protein [Hyphomonadaceae bacterium]